MTTLAALKRSNKKNRRTAVCDVRDDLRLNVIQPMASEFVAIEEGEGSRAQFGAVIALLVDAHGKQLAKTPEQRDAWLAELKLEDLKTISDFIGVEFAPKDSTP